MAVKIRLARRGRKKQALYDVVVADARAPRDGRYIEKIGRYNPNTDPATVELNEEKAFEWVMKGAQPTDTVRAMLSYRGIMLKKHLQIGVNKGAITQEEADKKFNAWLEDKEGKIQAKRDKLAKAAADSAKARKEAETKVKEARAEALKKKNIVEEAPAEEAPEAAAEGTEVAEAADEPKAEAGEEAKEETPAEEEGKKEE
ncbi:SSU ribosomal protein S16p [Fulvivirga imtechensis AK7]|uniref:Small ribosomal subunit protein bS16 n=1 Tax=Fulvivirga imtechensis AK7 TaxID=1237149 RepID=L8JUW7_9BACT|nr:30S ribosomal protein S16 [Fulvivirga imtechensis]ELR71369.1 SSU ribosomal protein S16p [Fulvivirga imtechensis AK7]